MANTLKSNTELTPPGWFWVEKRSPLGGAAARSECHFLEATGSRLRWAVSFPISTILTMSPTKAFYFCMASDFRLTMP